MWAAARQSCIVVASRTFTLGPHMRRVDRTEPREIAGEIKDQAIGLAVSWSGATPCALHVPHWRTGRPHDGDQVDGRRIEAGGKYIDADEAPDAASLEVGNQIFAFAAWRAAGEQSRIDAAFDQSCSEMIGVIDADGEHQPGFPVGAVRNDLIGDFIGEFAAVEPREITRRIVAADDMQTGHVEALDGVARSDEWREIIGGDEIEILCLERYFGEQPIIALGQAARVRAGTASR